MVSRFMQFSQDILQHGIGKVIYNTKHKVIGRIAAIAKDGGQKPNYLILSNDHFSDFGSKYFAIPLTDTFIKIAGNGRMVLNIKKDDLLKASGINFDSNTILKSKNAAKSIFELIDYHCPLNHNFNKAN